MEENRNEFGATGLLVEWQECDRLRDKQSSWQAVNIPGNGLSRDTVSRSQQVWC